MSTTLFESPQYDPARERRRKLLVGLVLILAIIIAVLAWLYRNWPEEHVVAQFFNALEHKEYERAYGIWMHDPDWQQHPDRYKNYSYAEFYKDWGPSGPWGIIKSFRLAGSATPPRGGSGIIVVVTVNNRTEKARLWVEKKDKTLTFSPY